MNDELISFETAKLAKEKGFNWKNIEILEVESKSAFLDSTTQSLIQTWLRDVHGIHIFITHKLNIKKWDFMPYNMNMNGKEYVKYYKDYYKTNNSRRFDSYEEALEAGLQEALKLI